MTCRECGEILREGMCPVCDYGWDPNDRASWDTFGRAEGMPPSVPYTADGRPDLDHADGQLPAQELQDIRELEAMFADKETTDETD